MTLPLFIINRGNVTLITHVVTHAPYLQDKLFLC